MKKSLILAASLAAVVLGGVLAGCSDDSSSSSYILPSADTLPAPVGTNNPFKTGNYKWKEEWKWGEEEDDAPGDEYLVSVNAEKYTIDMEMGNEVHKYTYNENTHQLTKALYKRMLPTDMDKYLKSFISGEGYDGKSELADRTTYTTAVNTFLTKLQPLYKDSPNAEWETWGEYYTYQMDLINDFYTLDVYDYKVVDENTVELTRKGYDFEDGSWEEKVTLTFVSAE